MPPATDQAICLRRWEWSETSQTAVLFTRDHGLVRGLAKGSRRDRAPFSGGLEPLTTGDLSFIHRPKRGLDTITAWDLTDPGRAFRRSLPLFAAGHAVAELATSLFAEHDPAPGAFDAIARFMRAGDADAGASASPDDRLWPALLRCQVALLVASGLAPDLTGIDALGDDPDAPLGFDPVAGVLVPDPGPRAGPSPADNPAAAATPWRLRASTASAIRTLIRSTETGQDPAANPAAPSRASLFLIAWISLRLGRPLRTTPELRRLTAAAPPAGAGT